MLEQRQHLLLNYFKTQLSVGPAGNRTPASRTIDWHLTNLANLFRAFELNKMSLGAEKPLSVNIMIRTTKYEAHNRRKSRHHSYVESISYSPLSHGSHIVPETKNALF